MGRIWAVCSGSGGVGKSMIALSLAAGAAREGKNVILLDASGVARACDLILGLESVIVLDMLDVISGQIEMEAALYPSKRYEGLRFACSSLYHDIPVSELSAMVIALNSMCDVLVIDLPTGQTEIGKGVMCNEDLRVVVTRPDSISIRSAERALIKNHGIPSVLVINRAVRSRNKRSTQLTSDAVQSILDCAVMGCIPEDPSIPASEQNGRAAIECDGPAWTALKELLQAILAGV